VEEYLFISAGCTFRGQHKLVNRLKKVQSKCAMTVDQPPSITTSVKKSSRPSTQRSSVSSSAIPPRVSIHHAKSSSKGPKKN
jgi:hypothetical protein